MPRGGRGRAAARAYCRTHSEHSLGSVVSRKPLVRWTLMPGWRARRSLHSSTTIGAPFMKSTPAGPSPPSICRPRSREVMAPREKPARSTRAAGSYAPPEQRARERERRSKRASRDSGRRGPDSGWAFGWSGAHLAGGATSDRPGLGQESLHLGSAGVEAVGRGAYELGDDRLARRPRRRHLRLHERHHIEGPPSWAHRPGRRLREDADDASGGERWCVGGEHGGHVGEVGVGRAQPVQHHDQQVRRARARVAREQIVRTFDDARVAAELAGGGGRRGGGGGRSAALHLDRLARPGAQIRLVQAVLVR